MQVIRVDQSRAERSEMSGARLSSCERQVHCGLCGNKEIKVCQDLWSTHIAWNCAKVDEIVFS